MAATVTCDYCPPTTRATFVVATRQKENSTITTVYSTDACDEHLPDAIVEARDKGRSKVHKPGVFYGFEILPYPEHVAVMVPR